MTEQTIRKVVQRVEKVTNGYIIEVYQQSPTPMVFAEKIIAVNFADLVSTLATIFNESS